MDIRQFMALLDYFIEKNSHCDFEDEYQPIDNLEKYIVIRTTESGIKDWGFKIGTLYEST